MVNDFFRYYFYLGVCRERVKYVVQRVCSKVVVLVSSRSLVLFFGDTSRLLFFLSSRPRNSSSASPLSCSGGTSPGNGYVCSVHGRVCFLLPDGARSTCGRRLNPQLHNESHPRSLVARNYRR